MNADAAQGRLHGFCTRSNTHRWCGFYAIIKKRLFNITKDL